MRYRVDFYVRDKIVAHTYRDGWCRRDAYHDAINSSEYLEAMQEAQKYGATVMWDATKIDEASNLEVT